MVLGAEPLGYKPGPAELVGGPIVESGRDGRDPARARFHRGRRDQAGVDPAAQKYADRHVGYQALGGGAAKLGIDDGQPLLVPPALLAGKGEAPVAMELQALPVVGRPVGRPQLVHAFQDRLVAGDTQVMEVVGQRVGP